MGITQLKIYFFHIRLGHGIHQFQHSFVCLINELMKLFLNLTETKILNKAKNPYFSFFSFIFKLPILSEKNKGSQIR